jgi:hypothetical protein
MEGPCWCCEWQPTLEVEKARRKLHICFLQSPFGKSVFRVKSGSQAFLSMKCAFAAGHVASRRLVAATAQSMRTETIPEVCLPWQLP